MIALSNFNFIKLIQIVIVVRMTYFIYIIDPRNFYIFYIPTSRALKKQNKKCLN